MADQTISNQTRQHEPLSAKIDDSGHIVPILPDSGSEKHEESYPTGSLDEPNSQTDIDYVQGSRFWLITLSLALSLFLTNLEIPIVTTSLVAITNSLGGFDQVGWVISSYLLGYVGGVLVIFAKLSDIFGRRSILSLSISIFIVFSSACGAAQTMTQLIIFRAFQGVGGGGCFAIASALITEIVPPEKYAKYAANLSGVYALSLLTGPIIGGAISADTTWRWIFLINVPPAIPALVFAITAIPKGFPYHEHENRRPRTLRMLLNRNTLTRIDFIGSTLLLLATLSLTAGFEEADARFAWKSPYVITLLTISGFLWIGLLCWERHVTNNIKAIEPVLPWRFATNRVMIGLLLRVCLFNSVFLGGPWFVAIFQLPQKFQLVYGTSALQAGIRLMPFTFAAPIGSFFSSSIGSKLKVPAIYLVLCSALLQVVGFSLLASLPESSSIPRRIYGFQIIAGFGCGMNISNLILMVPFSVDFRDKAVGMGAVSQLRPMGGVLALAIATSVFNSHVRPGIAELLGLSLTEVRSILNGHLFGDLSPELLDRARIILAQGYNRQMVVLAAFAAAQIPATLLMWQKQQIRV